MRYNPLFAPSSAKHGECLARGNPPVRFVSIGVVAGILLAASAARAQSDGAWQSADIGTTTAGQTTVSGDTVTLTGSGNDIWNDADGFRYYYLPTTAGDNEMIVRVASLQDTNGWAKAGIMLRQSLDPGSAQAWVCVSAEHGTAFQWRATTNGDTQSTDPSEDGGAPRWLKLVFKAAGPDEPIPASVSSYVSFDGANWIQTSHLFLGLTFQYIGLAVTSHNDGTLCKAQFDNLRLLTPAPAPTGFQVTHRGPNGEIDLAWTYNTSDVDQFIIESNPETAGDHVWSVDGTVPGSARQAVIHIPQSDGAMVQITAYRDFVASPSASLWAIPTLTPSLAVTSTTSSSITLRVTEEYGYGGSQNGPWAVERSTDGVNFVQIISGLTPTNGGTYYDYTDYTDNGLPAGVTRYYRARQLLSNGDSSAYSNMVSAATSGSSPTGSSWLSQDIGSVAAHGSTSSDSSGTSVTVSGSGADIWGTADAFQFGYQTLATDGTLTVRVASMTDTNGWAKAGIMVRQTLDANSPNLFVGVTPEWHGIVAQARSSVNGDTSQWQGPAANAPYWLRLTRSGGTFSAQTSPDGVTWTTLFNPFNFASSTVYIGFAVTSHNDGTLCTATFDHVSLVAGGVPVVVNLTPPPNGTYGAGNALNFTANFSASVNVTGTPGLTLTIGSTTRQAAYVSGSGTANLVFRYTVASGDVDTDGIMVSSPINLDGGTIKDGSGTDATLAFTPPDTSQILVNGGTTTSASVITGITPGTPVSGGATTSSSAFTFTGTADPNSTVDLWLLNETNNTSPLEGAMAEVTASNTGAWSASVSGFMPGTYSFSSFVRNSSTSNNSSSPPFTVTVQSPTGSGQWGNNLIHASSDSSFGGSTSFTDGTISVTSRSSDIWGTGDTFQYFADFTSGDLQIVAHVASITNTDPWAKAGVMIRETTDSGARNVLAAITPAWNGVIAQARNNPGDITTSAAGPGANPPGWLRLVRTGSTFTAAFSADGATWTTYATFNVAMNSSAYVGLAVTSHDTSTNCTATFDHVSVQAVTSGGGSVPAAPTTLAANPLSNSQIELTWYPGDTSQTGFQLERATASGGPFQAITTMPATAERYVDGGLTAGTNYFYRIDATDSAGASPYSNVANSTVPFSNGPTPATTLAATATGPQSVALQWTPGSGQFTWQVERSPDGIHFALMYETGSSQGSLTDLNVQPSSIYYYRVRSHDGGGWSPYSNIASVTTPASGSGSSSWSFADIGSVGLAGSNTASGSTITISGSGTDIWDTADGFYFVWKTWNGDGVVEAEVSSMANTNGWAKAGVMIRESTDAGARNLFVALTPTWHGIVAQARANANDVTAQTAGPAVNAPYWVKLARSGNTFTASTSPDGVNWTAFATFNVTMNSTADFGFAVTSHDNTQLNQSVFNNPFVGAQ